ncbi:hypothetical protein C8F01DRAFT_1160774 [Mycena amicta]|nr:hypothetical protein C8F01DRAFT_1160774 [Mycena amicta]
MQLVLYHGPLAPSQGDNNSDAAVRASDRVEYETCFTIMLDTCPDSNLSSSSCTWTLQPILPWAALVSKLAGVATEARTQDTNKLREQTTLLVQPHGKYFTPRYALNSWAASIASIFRSTPMPVPIPITLLSCFCRISTTSSSLRKAPSSSSSLVDAHCGLHVYKTCCLSLRVLSGRRVRLGRLRSNSCKTAAHCRSAATVQRLNDSELQRGLPRRCCSRSRPKRCRRGGR